MFSLSRSSLLAVLFISMITQPGFSQEVNQWIMDEDLGREVLLGDCDRNGLQSGEFAEPYLLNYMDYKPSESVIRKLKKIDVDYQILIVLASWCGDSKRQLPAFMKLADLAGISDVISMIGVNRRKAIPGKNIDSLEIDRVPTFIIYRNSHEIGRIVESPSKSLEKDLLKILQK